MGADIVDLYISRSTLLARELPNCWPKAARLTKSEFSHLVRLSTFNYQPSTCEIGGISSFHGSLGTALTCCSGGPGWIALRYVQNNSAFTRGGYGEFSESATNYEAQIWNLEKAYWEYALDLSHRVRFGEDAKTSTRDACAPQSNGLD